MKKSLTFNLFYYFSVAAIASLLLTVGCQSKSYYSANNKNLQRFGGYQLETANHLVKVNDLEMLIIDMSELAEAEALKRDIYVASQEVQERFEKMKLETKMEAAIQRVTLSTSLSAESDKYFHRLTNTSRDNFDQRYVNMMLEKLNELKSLLTKYQEEGHSDRVQKLGDEKIYQIEKHIKQFSAEGII